MTKKKMFVEIKPGDSLTIGDAVVRLEKKSGQVARLVIEANEATHITIPVTRKSASAIAAERIHDTDQHQ